tara:strand:- start:2020 stop:3066 length:1047 start_codon:yes stop_codon:yes gene_type:complete
MKEIFIVSNDKFYTNKKDFFNSNKNTFTWINCFEKLSKIYLIARISKKKLSFKSRIRKIKLLTFFDLFSFKEQIRAKKILIISLTPFSFLIGCFLLILGAKKNNIFLWLVSDGLKEYSIKYGFIGKMFYETMLFFLKKRVSIITCSVSLKNKYKAKLVLPSEITSIWFKNRKSLFKKRDKKKRIDLLYLGRVRKEKGYENLINLFDNIKLKSSLSIVGNDFKYLKKRNYPINPNIKIFGQVSSETKVINFYDKSDIFILPSYSEAYPQVILESFSRLKPVIMFREINFLKKVFPKGLFCCDRNSESLEKTIKNIIFNYKKVQLEIYKSKLHTLKDFKLQMFNVLKKNN